MSNPVNFPETVVNTRELKLQAQHLPDGRTALGIMLEDGIMQFILVLSSQDMMRLARGIKKIADSAPTLVVPKPNGV